MGATLARQRYAKHSRAAAVTAHGIRQWKAYLHKTMRDIIMATQRAQALSEWLQQFPQLQNSTDDAADVTPPPPHRREGRPGAGPSKQKLPRQTRT